MSNFIEKAFTDLMKATADNTTYLAKIERALQQEQLEKVASQAITTAYYLPLSGCQLIKLGASTLRRASISFLIQGGSLLVSSSTFDPVGESNNYKALTTNGVGDSRDSKVIYLPANTSPIKVETTGDLYMASYCPTGQAAGAMLVNVIETVYDAGLPSGKTVVQAYHEAQRNALK